MSLSLWTMACEEIPKEKNPTRHSPDRAGMLSQSTGAWSLGLHSCRALSSQAQMETHARQRFYDLLVPAEGWAWVGFCPSCFCSQIQECAKSATFASNSRSSRSEIIGRIPFFAVFVKAAEGDVVTRTRFGLVSPDCSLDCSESDLMYWFCVHSFFIAWMFCREIVRFPF